jgi:hypothetical protein
MKTFSRALLAIGALLLLHCPQFDRAIAQTAIAAGKCIIVNQNIKLESGATLIVENNDCSDGTPENSYVLRFFWVDSKNISMIMAGYYDSALQSVLGRAPKLFTNEVHKVLKEIVASFGTLPAGYGNMFFGSSLTNTVQSATKTASGPRTGLHEIPAHELRKLKFYTGEQKILWPDIAASKAVRDSSKWPPGYSMTYAGNTYSRFGNSVKPSDLRFSATGMKESIRAAFRCTVLYKNVTRAEVENYWAEMDAVEKAILQGSIEEMFFVNSELSTEQVQTFKHAALLTSSIEAVQYFTSKSKTWPSDFLIKVGSMFPEEDCGGNTNFGVYAVPRKLFALLAVVEPKGSSVAVGGASFVSDGKEELRVPTESGQAEDVNFSPITLKRGESLVIPLQVELRYDADEFPISAIQSNPVAGQFHAAIAKAPMSAFSWPPVAQPPGQKGAPKAVRIIKEKQEFKPPAFQAVERKYVFGRSYDLTALQIGGKRVETRKTPRVAVVMNARFEEGSCPFLYFRDPEGQISLFGRVLIGAVGQAGLREERIRVSSGMSSFIIKEHEPEVTFIKRISLHNDETGEERVLATDFYIGVNKHVEFAIPDGFQARSEIVISGYYNTFQAGAVAQMD